VSSINAFPLAWPEGWPRAKHRKSSPYKVSTDKALESVLGDLRLMRGRSIIVSSNVPLRRDGTMYRGDHSDSAMPDPGVAVYWDDRDGKPRVIACDVWRTVRENVRAIGLTLEALRMIDRAGASHLLERAFSGFARLPAPADCWGVLGLDRGASRESVTKRFRELALQHHPDRGGSTESMARINAAYQEAIRA
jgi:hypothetical protein